MILTETQASIRNTIRDYAQDRLRPRSREFEASGGYPPEIFRDAGSDASAIRTRATRAEGGWRLDGSKQFISSGRIGGLATVFAVTDPEAGKKGISALLVPIDSAGYSIDKVEHKLGQWASDTCALRFDDLLVEDALMLGGEGQGYRIVLSGLE